jgi:hypothetical protein
MPPEAQTEPEVVVGPEPLAPRVVAVRPVGDAVVLAVFEDGVQRVFDVGPLLSRGVFKRLADAEAFATVRVIEGGGGSSGRPAPTSRRTGYTSAGRLESRFPLGEAITFVADSAPPFQRPCEMRGPALAG